jgi:hypothetical protein
VVAAGAVGEQALGDVSDLVALYEAIEQDDEFIVCDLVDDVLGAQGLDEALLDELAEFLGELVAVGFLDFAVAVEFEDQAGGDFIGGTGRLKMRGPAVSFMVLVRGVGSVGKGMTQAASCTSWSLRRRRAPGSARPAVFFGPMCAARCFSVLV